MMRRARLLMAAWAMLAAAAPPAPPAPPGPPRAQPGDVADVIQGVRIADPYRWLEDADAPAVKAWVAGQNAASRAYLAALPGRQALFDWLMAVDKATPVYDRDLRVAGGRMFVQTVAPDKQQPMLAIVSLDGAQVARRIVLDPNLLSKTGDVAIDWYEPSPDGRLVAVSLSAGGSEAGTLHVYDVATGAEVEPPIAHVQFPTAGGSVAWAADGRGYWYTRYPDAGPEAERAFNQSVRFHIVGRAAAEDRVVLGAADGVPRTGEIFLAGAPGGTQALASVQLGDGGEWQHFLLTPDGARKVAAYDDRIVAATFGPDGTLYGISRKGAPKGAIATLAAGSGAGAWRTLVPEASYAIDASDFTRSLVVSGARLYATAMDGGPTRLLAYTLAGTPVAVATPPVAAIDGIAADGAGGVYYRLRRYTVPSVFVHLAAGTAEPSPTPLRLRSPLDFSDIAVSRVFATSADGTKVPVTLMMKRGTQATGANPTLLYGYGGYGLSLSPAFLRAPQRAWFDAGGIYAIANIRGGAEYGDAWHAQGALTHKQNVFDDFAAAARLLVADRWTAPAHLALMGESNGGLLMGATVTQHPELARAVVSRVGIYDMIRVERDPNGSFNVTEFGSVRDPAQFRALAAYSPYHRVAAGTRYPAMLLTTGDNDGRVNPLHSRKFTAAMQAATASGLPIYLRTTDNAGHGMGSSLDVRVAEETDIAAFLYDQLGMHWTPPVAAGSATQARTP